MDSTSKQDRYTDQLPAGLEDQLNQQLDELVALLVDRQEQFFQEYGRYWQGLITHNEIPDLGNPGNFASLPDAAGNKPAAEDLGWQDMLPEIQHGLPFSLTVSRYHGPDGFGWTMQALFKFAGRYYMAQVAHGENTPESMLWTAMDPDWDPGGTT